MRRGLFAAHANSLPADLVKHAITLGEGSTPLLRLRHLPAKHKADMEIWVKVEGGNPSGSFKDRGMVVAVTAALARKARAVVCASTGNTSASAAAYAAAAGLPCIVLLPSGKVAAGKLAQATAHGARCYLVEGNFDMAMQAVQGLKDSQVEIVNSINPMRIQGQKTIAFEVIEQLGRPPDWHSLPVGNAGNITAHWLGYTEATNDGKQTAKPPRMLGVQAQGAAPFLAGKPLDNPETVATAIRIGNPQSWQQAIDAVSESDGKFTSVDDENLLATQHELASEEGVFCEPASAASVAGALAQAKAGTIAAGSVVVCTLTGHGLKDPDAVAERTDFRRVEDAGGIEKVLAAC